jgi:N-methylhydantoinase A
VTRVLGVDVGGTFTDLVLADGTGVRVAKVASTPADQSEGILAGLDRLALDAASVDRFVHGTTVATNTVLERDGARVVLVTTAGVGDLLHLARQDRPHLYDLAARRPPPVVDRAHVVEARERIAADGSVVIALEDAEVARVTDAVAALEPDAIAISLLFSFLDPDHEQRLASALAALDVPISRSSALLPVFREVERTSTVALNAYVAPRLRRYLGRLSTRLDEAGLTADLEVMRSGGGTFTAEVAGDEPVHTLLSGPAAGAWGAAGIGLRCGVPDLIAFDVGGTSTDVTLVTDGRPTTTADGAIDDLPFAVPTTDIHTIGSGGGSLAWRDEGGALRVGPRSAGAQPGPACYGNGGTGATVTDANVVLGRLDGSVQLGGALPLDVEAAHRAVERLASQLGLDVEVCAAGIVRVTDAQMAAALRVVSVARGRDPRRFALLPFGGAGPLHQAALARELGTPEVLVPPNPGVLSALGLLAAPVTAEGARSQVRPLDQVDGADLETAWSELEAAAGAQLARQGVTPAAQRRSADLRYRGQAFELEVEAGPRADPSALADAFHAAHRERYGYDQLDAGVELVTVRCRLEGAARSLPLPSLTGGGDLEHASRGQRRVHEDGSSVQATLVDRAALGAGATLRGPAVVVGLDATVFVGSWQRGEVDDHGTLRLTEAPA